MSTQFEVSPDNKQSPTGSIILNGEGRERACKIYCETMGIDYAEVDRKLIDLADLMKTHMAQAGINLHDFMQSHSRVKPAQRDVIMKIIKQRTMAPREVIRREGGSEQLVGTAHWESISPDSLIAFATLLREKIYPDVPSIIMPDELEAAEEKKTIGILCRGLGLQVPDSVKPHGLLVLIANNIKISMADFKNLGIDPTVIHGKNALTPRMALQLLDFINKKHGDARTDLQSEVRNFFTPIEVPMKSGVLLALTPVENICGSRTRASFGKWHHKVEFTLPGDVTKHVMDKTYIFTRSRQSTPDAITKKILGNELGSSGKPMDENTLRRTLDSLLFRVGEKERDIF